MQTLFAIGQKYQTKRNPKKYAEVVQVRDDPHDAWVQMRDGDGRLLDEAWVNYRRFLESWERI